MYVIMCGGMHEDAIKHMCCLPAACTTVRPSSSLMLFLLFLSPFHTHTPPYQV